MAPPIAVRQNAPTNSAKTPAPATNLQVGELATRFEAAQAKVVDAEVQLSRVEAALADPKHADKKADLLALKTKYTAELKAATGPRDAAKKALDTAVATIPGNGTARSQVEKVWGRIEGIDAEIAKLKKGPGMEQASADAKAATETAKKYGPTHPKADAALKKAEASLKGAKQAEKDVVSLQNAKEALTHELAKREPAALDEAKKRDPSLKNLGDVVDLAGDTRARQMRVIGAPVVGVSADEAVKADVSRIDLAMGKVRGGQYADDRAASGAKMLDLQLKEAKPEHAEAMVKAAGPQIRKMTEVSRLSKASAAPLLDALGTAQGPAKTAMALEMAKAIKTVDWDNDLIKTLDARLQNGIGYEDAVELRKAFEAAGKPDAAKAVNSLIVGRLAKVTDEFNDASAKLAPVKADLARLVAGFGPLLPADKQQAAISDFKSRHKAEFEAWEQAGAKLANASQYIANNMADDHPSLKALPEALTTTAGQNMLLDAVEARALGKPNFLQNAKDVTKFAKYVTPLVVKAVGQHAIGLYAAGKTDKALEYLDKLKANADTFQMKPDVLDKSIKHLQGVMKGDTTALKEFEAEMRKVKPDNAGYKALKAVAWAASIANGVATFGDNKGEIKKLVKATTDTLGPSAEIIATGTEMFVNAQKARITAMTGLVGTKGAPITVDAVAFGEKAVEAATAQTARRLAISEGVVAGGKFVGGAMSGIGAVLDGVAALEAFKNGDNLEGAASTMSAVGGTILAIDTMAAAAGMQVIPVWGQVAGAALIIGGIVGKFATAAYREHEKEKNSENDAESFLNAAGIKGKAADELSDLKRDDGRNVGMMIQQLAPALGMEPKQLWDRIRKMDPDAINEFVDMTKDLVIKDGRVPQGPLGRLDSPTMWTENVPVDKGFTRPVKHYPQSLATAKEWTQEFLKKN